MKHAISLLIVEDDIDLRDELTTYMENFFTTIDTTDNTKSALELYEKNSYDLILTDIQLLGEDGLTLVESVKSISPQQLVIVMSAYQETEYFLKSIEIGIFAFLVKPFDSGLLMETMTKVIKLIDEEKNKKADEIWIVLSTNIKYNTRLMYLYIDNNLEILSQKEEKLLNILIKNIDGHVSDTQLKKAIWDDENIADSTLRVLIKRLREKLDYEDAIINLKGRGYKITKQSYIQPLGLKK